MLAGHNWSVAQRTGSVVVSVDCRLAPEVPFPGPLDDCDAALLWLVKYAADLNVDPQRIAVMGESGGGGLAAALALLVRDRGSATLAAQILVYPMLDYRTGTEEAPLKNPTTGEFGWTAQANRFGWSAMRGALDLSEQLIGYFSPARATN